MNFILAPPAKASGEEFHTVIYRELVREGDIIHDDGEFASRKKGALRLNTISPRFLFSWPNDWKYTAEPQGRAIH